MTVDKVDLGLSLSLTCSHNHSLPAPIYQTTPWSNLLASSVEEARPRLKGIDVIRKAMAVEKATEEEEEGASSPDSTLSSESGKRSGPDPFDIHQLERTGSRGISDEEDGDAGSRKKLRLSKDQSAILEECFKEHNTLNPRQKLALAKQLNLRTRQVEVWFQNRRARTKLKQTEVDCEYLKKWCERLTEENRRLQKEVSELRALKVMPPLLRPPPENIVPLTTLTMCPSCQRVNSSSTATTTATTSPLPNHHQFFPMVTVSSQRSSTLPVLATAYNPRSRCI
ncbi:homeobox-leucine zipper protein HAT4-like [Typha angustifolia]|uniref:homeobox-leucine zipper protein HAT4-like n=1 Tax=Typha angustifolia TaxID=59011 RepID=UPI003C2E3A88